MDDRFAGASSCINHDFSQVKYLQTALTHSSYANEKDLGEHNERLEFLGDAVLELVVSEEAYRRYPDAPEGQLTRVRSELVKERSLARLACDLGLDRHVLLGRGEEAQGGRARESLLADVVEAVFGAVFLDAGFAAARRVILCALEDRWPEATDQGAAKDFKSRLQEATQELFRARPVYALTGASGPEHEKVFTVVLTLPDGRAFSAEGSSMKRAEQGAARLALEALG